MTVEILLYIDRDGQHRARVRWGANTYHSKPARTRILAVLLALHDLAIAGGLR